MVARAPMSVRPRPLVMRPPRCCVASTSSTLAPSRAAATAAATPAAVPPMTATSKWWLSAPEVKPLLTLARPEGIELALDVGGGLLEQIADRALLGVDVGHQ